MITLIHQGRWNILVERLDAMVAVDATLAPARTLVKAPVALLAALGADVEAALGDDQLALDRVRALVSVSAVHAQPFSSMRALMSEPTTTNGATNGGASTRDALNDSWTTSIVDTGSVVLAALAAARAGADVGLPDAFVDHALALVLAATPAEALTRAIAAGLTDSQLRAMLAALVPADDADRHLSMALASFIADPRERSRWRALDSLFALVRQAPPTIWEGATSEGIVDVTPRSACGGQTIEIRVRLRPHATTAAPPHIAGLLADLADGLASVVFASSTAPPVAARAKSVNRQSGIIRVVLPQGTRAGWVGVTSPVLVAESNESRQQLRAFWETQNARHPALRHAPVPLDAIALLPNIPVPPPTGANRFDGGLPTIELLTIDPAVVDANSTASLRWRVGGAEHVTVDPIGAVAAAGVAPIEIPSGQTSVSARLTAANACGVITADTSARVRVSPGQRRVVIVRPVMLSPTFGRVSLADAHEAVQEASKSLGVQINAVMAPWIEQAGLVFDGIAGGPSTPATRRLLERLNLLSAQTSGLEDAVWVALVPGDDARLAVACAGDAAAAIAVATKAALAEVLRQPPELVEPATDRLSLVGSVDRFGAIRIIDIKARRRPAGAGASVETGLKVFGVDSTGRDVCSVPLRLHSDVLPASFVSLLPLAPEITRVEIRVVDVSDVIDTALFRPDPAGGGRWVARRIDRVAGEPALSRVRVRRRALQWAYRHDRGVAPNVAIELGRDGGWWPIQRADGFVSQVNLALERLSPVKGDVVRVVASDGWNTVTSRPARAPAVRPKRVAAHYSGDGRFWAEFEDPNAQPTWRLGRTVRKGPVVAVPFGYSGPVRLNVETDGRVIRDERVIEVLGGD